MLTATVKPTYIGATTLADDPLVAVIDDVLTAEEIAHVIDIASGRIQRAKVSLDEKGATGSGRTGGNCWLSYDSDPVIRRIGKRIAGIVGIPLSHAEALQVVHYGPGQEYRPHFDAYDMSTARGQRCCRRGGQRLVTGLVYLNDVPEGGATDFPKLGVSVHPKPGRLAIFHNTGADTSLPHPGSLHAGTPVRRGEKWAFNIWFRARPMDAIQESASPEREAPRRPSGYTSHDLVVNRATRLWRQARERIGTDFPEGNCFTYWDTFGGSQPDLSAVRRADRVVELIDRKAANGLSNKAILARALTQSGLTHLAPATFHTVGDALAHASSNSIWFVKPAFGTAGKGMFCVDNEGLSTLQLPGNHILQEGVDDLVLDEGCKFTSRVHVLIWNGEVRIFHTGMTVTHGAAYEAGSTDYRVQIDHRGYQNPGSPVRIRPGDKTAAFIEHFPALRNLVAELRPVMQQCIEASDSDHYQILGIDTLIRRDGTVQLIEVNSFPNFIHTTEVNDEVNVPLFESVIRTITSHPDARLHLVGDRRD